MYAAAQAQAAPQIGVTAALRGDVVRTASLQSGAAIGQMSSGQTVFLGDDIKVGSQGRLQVMLLDETIFTLGANSVMRIDEFVYDPADAANAKLSTSITQGAFRFVSGQIAKTDRDAMKVKLPGATIGVRGTSVAGDVAPDGTASVILLGPAPNNALGLPAGAINVANQAGAVDITRPGFITQLSDANQAVPPSAPVEATAQQIEAVELSLAEQASASIAEELGVDPATLNIESGEDTDGDGMLDSFKGNAVLGAALSDATADGGVTSDNALKAAVALTIFGDELLNMSDSEATSFFAGVNLGGGIAALIENGNFDYLGQTQITELSGLTGSTTFSASNAIIQTREQETIGDFSTVQTWNFSNSSVTTQMSGTFSALGGTLAGQMSLQPETITFADAQKTPLYPGAASFSFVHDFDSAGTGTAAYHMGEGEDNSSANLVKQSFDSGASNYDGSIGFVSLSAQPTGKQVSVDFFGAL
ncbi:MAG: FecR family protein, partial [Parvibaculales bacterium]